MRKAASTKLSREKATSNNIGSLPTSPEYYAAGPVSPCSSSPRPYHSIQLFCPHLRRWIPVIVQLSVRNDDFQVIMILSTSCSLDSTFGNSPRNRGCGSPKKHQSNSHVDMHHLGDAESRDRRVRGNGVRNSDNGGSQNKTICREVCVFSLAPRVALRNLSSDFRSELCLTPLDPDQQTYRSTDHPSPRHTGGSVEARSATSFLSEDCASSFGNSITGLEMAALGRIGRTSTQLPSGDLVVPPLTPPRKVLGSATLLKPQNQCISIGLPPRALFYGSGQPTLYANSRFISNPAEVLDILVECDSFPFLTEDFCIPEGEEADASGEPEGRLTKFLNLFTSGIRSEKNSGRSNAEKSRRGRGGQQESTTGSLNSFVAGLSLGAKASSARQEEENSILLTPALGSRSSSVNAWRSRGFPPSPQLGNKGIKNFERSSSSSALRKNSSSKRHIVLRCSSSSEFFRLLREYIVACDKIERQKVNDSPSLVCANPSADLSDITTLDDGDREVVSDVSQEPSVSPNRRMEGSRHHTPLLLPPAHDNQPPLPNSWMGFIRHTHNPQNGLPYAAIPPLFWSSMLDYAPQELYTFQSGVLVVEPLSSWKGPYTLAEVSPNTRRSRKAHGEALRQESPRTVSNSSGTTQYKDRYKEVKLELAFPPPHTVQTNHLLSPLLASREYEDGTPHSRESQRKCADDTLDDADTMEETYLTYRHVFACITANSLLFINTFGTIKLQLPLTDIRVVMFSERGENIGDAAINKSSPASWDSGNGSPASRKLRASAVLPFCTFIIRDNVQDASHEHDFAVTLTLLPQFGSSKSTFETQPTICSSVSTPCSPISKRNAMKLSNEMNPIDDVSETDLSGMSGPRAETSIMDERECLYNSLSNFIHVLTTLLPQTVTVHKNCGSFSQFSALGSRPDGFSAERVEGHLKNEVSCNIGANLVKKFPFCCCESANPSTSTSRASSPHRHDPGQSSSARNARVAVSPNYSASPNDLIWNANLAKSAAERRDFLKSSCCLVPVHLKQGVKTIRPGCFGYLKRRKIHHRFQDAIRSQGVLEMALSMRMAARCQLAEQLKQDANADFARHASARTSEITTPLTSGLVRDDWEDLKGRKEVNDSGVGVQKESVPDPTSDPEEEFVPIRPVKKRSTIIRNQMKENMK